jgi:hypothetical protein
MKISNFQLKYEVQILIWIIRVCLTTVACIFAYFWLNSKTVANTGQIIFSTFIALSSAGLIASFIRTNSSLILLELSIIITPLGIFLPLDMSLGGRWWDWYVLILQMGIPCFIAYLFWKTPAIRNYYKK